MRVLYLIRHGQASFGAAEYDQLSKLGYEQGRLLGAWFKQCGIDVQHVVAGGSNRHIQTAEAFLSTYDSETDWAARIRRDADFNEVDNYDMMNPSGGEANLNKDGTRMTFAEFRTNMTPAYLRWTSGQYDHQYKQPFSAYSGACAGAMARAFDLASHGETVAVFTSGGTIAMICRQIMPLGDEATSELMWVIGNTSVTRIAWENERPVLTLFNSMAHLDQTGDRSMITIT